MGTGAHRSRGRRTGGKGPFKYTNPEDNHVIWPGREQALRDFIRQPYGHLQHKLRNAHSSNSEDALTWSCFDTLAHLSIAARQRALAEIWELAFDHPQLPAGIASGKIFIGKRYPEDTKEKEATEVDSSIEGDRVLAFVEAKLYSPMSAADKANGSRLIGLLATSTVGAETFRRCKQSSTVRQSRQPPRGRSRRTWGG